MEAMTTSRRALSAAALLTSTALLAGCGAISGLVGGTTTPTGTATSDAATTDAATDTTTDAATPTDNATSDSQQAGGKDVLLTADELGIGNNLSVDRQQLDGLGPEGEFTMSYTVDGVDLPKSCADAIQALNDSTSPANGIEILQYSGDFSDAAVDNPSGDDPSLILYHVTTDQEGSLFDPVGAVQKNCSTADGQGGQLTMTTVPLGSYPNSFFTTMKGGGQTLTFAAVGQDYGTDHVYLLALNLTPEAVQKVADAQKAKAEQKLG